MLAQLGAQRGRRSPAGELREQAARPRDLLRRQAPHRVLELLAREQLLDPDDERFARRLEPLLHHLTAHWVEHGRLEDGLVDVDRGQREPSLELGNDEAAIVTSTPDDAASSHPFGLAKVLAGWGR